MSVPSSELRKRSGTESHSQRAKRPRDGAEFVEIDGVPPDVSPKLVEAIRAAKTFFKHHRNDVISPHFDSELVNENSRDLVASIMDRVEQAKERENRKKEDTRRNDMTLALYSWLHSLDHQSKGSRSSSVACFEYVWKTQEHERPSVRRMSLYLCGHLLLRNDDCRDRWQDTLLDWISTVIQVKVPEKFEKDALLWQKEAMLWVSEVSHQFPENNKFLVAKMYLDQRGPSLKAEGSHAGKNMADWRRIRDIALLHGVRQCDHVEKLVRRAFDSIDTLMPRVGDDEHDDSADSLIGDDENDDIDWEDGDEDEARETHVAAVEQTLALMETTGGVRGGDIEIRLDSNGNEGGDDNRRSDRERKRLQKRITSLSTKHLPCLSTWVNALNASDNLVLQNESLVSMSSDRLRERQIMLQRLSHVKRSVASVLSAASKLEVNVEERRESGTHGSGFQTNVPRRHHGLASTMERRVRGPSSNITSKRSNRIKIKFNK